VGVFRLVNSNDLELETWADQDLVARVPVRLGADELRRLGGCPVLENEL
jgi:hypothetical protein